VSWLEKARFLIVLVLGYHGGRNHLFRGLSLGLGLALWVCWGSLRFWILWSLGLWILGCLSLWVLRLLWLLRCLRPLNLLFFRLWFFGFQPNLTHISWFCYLSSTCICIQLFTYIFFFIRYCIFGSSAIIYDWRNKPYLNDQAA